MRGRTGLIAALLCVVGFCFSQSYSLRQFNKAQGLPDGYVYSAVQDQAGYLWVATGKGLSRFDGQRFGKIRADSLKDDIVSASACENSGTLWFGTTRGKLFFASQSSRTLSVLPAASGAPVKKIVPGTAEGNLYILTLGNGAFRYHKGQLLKMADSENYDVYDLLEIQKDLVLLSTSEGLFTCRADQKTLSALKGAEGPLKTVSLLDQTKRGVRILCGSGEILELQVGADVQLKTRSLVPELTPLVKVGIKEALYLREENDLIIATSDEKLYCYDLEAKQLNLFEENSYSASANSMFRDRTGNVWIASMGKGLYRLSKTPYTLLFPGEHIYAITSGRGMVYYGTSEGILVQDSATAKTVRVSKIGTHLLRKITALYVEGNRLWIGCEANGLLLTDVLTLKPLSVEFSAVPNIRINAIKGRGKDVCVATNLDGVFNYSEGRLRDHFSVQNSLLHNNVYNALISKRGRIYYATHNTSFNYSERGQLFEMHTKDLGLTSDFNDFAESADGSLFIATHGEGVYVLKDTSLQSFEFNDRLDSKFCEAVSCDASGAVWIAGRYNAYTYYPVEKAFHAIKLPELSGFMFSPGALHTNAQGEVFFGSNRGALRFKRGSTAAAMPQPELVQLWVQDSLFLGDASHVQLKNGLYRIAFDFSALDLYYSEDVIFSYQLEGRDDNWSEPSKAPRAEYSKLDEGDYVFKVKAYNSQGFSAGERVLARIQISAPYWKHPAFWLSLVLLLLLLFFFLLRYRTASLVRAKQKLEVLVDEKTKELREEKELVEKSNVRIEEQNQEIRDSITYARRIQEALLAGKDLLSKNGHGFVLYQPRDIVSGDFYWIAEINGLKVIAAADCTGHGVPGALMSMVGTTLLNKIILERKITRPGAILNELDKEIKTALKQHTEDSTRDGMDICLCVLDQAQNRLLYAGAMRPLFQVRDHQLTEIEPTKHAIGGFSYGKEKLFAEVEIATQKRDMFYLFSDGYADQFGGEKGKKLMLKNFKKILVSIAEMELTKQEENLKRVYANWKGELEQVDDVLVIGVKI